MNKKSLLLVAFALCFSAFISFGQTILVFNENFESGGTSFTINATGVGSNTGQNQWIVNGDYNLFNTSYPTTPSQDSTCSGTITNAPFGKYLHIYDANTASPANAIYDPHNASDRFAYMTSGVCTQGMTNTSFNFFYNCMGSATAWGEVYYSINNGPWTQCGSSEYHNTHCWQYVSITNPLFNGVSSLQFGFRWVNSAASAADTNSFAVDDVIIAGDFNTNITATVSNIQPDTVCQNSSFFFQVTLSDTLCDGVYAVYLSDSTGNFATQQEIAVFDIFAPTTSTFLGFNVPSSWHTGPCYKVRVDRMSPPPAFSGVVSGCFTVVACPNTITTLQPVVTMDTNAVCVGSVIDIPFYSSGTWHLNNNYVAQLSDQYGNFGSNPTIVGTDNLDSATYVYPPGTVSGIVPDVPDGCNYYIRIVGNQPATIGSLFGPFCIQHCDINTNEHRNVQICLTPTDSAYISPDSVLDVDVHSFTNNQAYAPGNIFKVELKSMMTFAQVGTLGAIGQQAATGDTIVRIIIPNLATLMSWGIAPGAYYGRVVATNATYQDSSLGNLIHITIGAPADTPPSVDEYYYSTFQPVTGHICPGDLIYFLPNPYNSNSQYIWHSLQLNPNTLEQNYLLVQFGAGGFDFIYTVQEMNFGCAGPVSAPDTLIVDNLPAVNVTGLFQVCQHDTATYTVPFGQNTYYDWTSNFGHVIDTANNILNIRFDSLGLFQMSVIAVNHCGSATGHKNVHVNPYPTLTHFPDSTICSNNQVILSTKDSAGYAFAWYNGTSTSTSLGSNDSLTVNPQTSETIILKVTYNPGACSRYDTININVHPAPFASHTDSLCIGDTKTLTSSFTGSVYQWSNGASTNSISVNAAGNYAAIVTIPDSLCAAVDSFHITVDVPVTRLLDTTICFGDVINLYAGGGAASYNWNNGETTQSITYTSPGSISHADSSIFFAQVHYTGNVCTNVDSFRIFRPAQNLVNRADSMCPGDPLMLVASSTDSLYLWNVGLTTKNITVYDTGVYYVRSKDPNARCYNSDSIRVTWKNCDVMTIPNVFSPNGDGKNEFFTPITVGVFDKFHLEIFNRWGLLIWESNDPEFKWNGKTKAGNDCPDGTYFYIITTTYQNKVQNWDGFVTLIR